MTRAESLSPSARLQFPFSSELTRNADSLLGSFTFHGLLLRIGPEYNNLNNLHDLHDELGKLVPRFLGDNRASPQGKINTREE